MKSKRVYITITIAAAIIAAVFLLPLPISRVRDVGLVTVNPRFAETLTLNQPAHLVSLAVVEGQQVKSGQLIAKFDSRDLQEKIAQEKSRRDEKRAEVDVLQRAEFELRKLDDRRQLESQIITAKSEASQHEQMMAMAETERSKLNKLIATRDGVVMGLVKPSEVGKLFDKITQQSKPICTVGDPTKLLIKVPVSPMDHKLLMEDLPRGGELLVSVYVAGRTDRIFTGKIRELPKSSAKQVPQSLTNKGGGPLAVQQSGENGQELSPVAQVYIVEIEVNDPDASIKPGALVADDAALLEFCRDTGATIFHPSGTCRMGRDAMAVVDERLRVHGVQGLRVIDASVMPTLVSGNTNGPIVMMAEKAADMIRQDARVV